jgi:predicted hydrocarbon binding protein
MDRINFLKKACFAGVCFCGFSNISGLANNSSSENKDINKQLNQEWLSNLLTNLNQDLEAEVLRKIIKKSAIVHYNDLNMNTLLSEYIGDLDKFCKFLEDKWGWKIDYNKTTKVLIADENKDYCVCPILEHKKGLNSSAICYCSEGFAERMFSLVTKVPVKAIVTSSVRKGDKSCVYRIEIQ